MVCSISVYLVSCTVHTVLLHNLSFTVFVWFRYAVLKGVCSAIKMKNQAAQLDDNDLVDSVVYYGGVDK